jgi:hypothetical protein
MVGGAYRGPVGVGRQRRAIRLVQGLLVLLAAGLLAFAGYSLGLKSGYDDGKRAGEVDAPRPPAATQTIVLGVLGLAAFGAALGLQSEGGVRLLTPARLREMEARGELPIELEEPEPVDVGSGRSEES